ncbi:palmdelphin-like isoform X2 [Pelmatolapia mariae]|uniref:palmdelphin-like isoform X2 n=1 Tax=Pelmatolapia mariae TaxID=158779 RepID=UPI002FE61BA9
MEESDLLKERLQAITQKHRIQEDIKKKKVKLDQEKFKLQHLKKKALREQWLLRDSHNGVDCTQQQSFLSDREHTRALQLSIHRIEMEVDSLEREESMISVNESFILSRLKAVEKSPEDIIKEAHNSFVPEPLHITTAIPESFSSPASEQSLFNMQINVAKNTLTGERSVLSTPDVPLKDFHQNTGLRVYDDVQKCVCALNSQQASRDQNGVSELSANEVEHLLRSATMHCQAKHQNCCQNPRTREEQCFSHYQDDRNRVEEHDLGKQPGRYDVLQRHKADKDFSCNENSQRKPHSEHHYCNQDSCFIKNEGRSQQSNLTESCVMRLDHYGNQRDCHCSSYPVTNCHRLQEGGSASHQPSGITRSSSRITEPSRCCVPLRTHDQETLTHTRFSYTPCYIPAIDYISEEEHYRPSLYQSNRQTGNRHRAPFPLTGDDPPCPVLSVLDTAEPITAIFVGFQSALDESRQAREFEGSLKAELVIVEDDEDYDDSNMKEKKSHGHIPKPSASNGAAAHVQGLGDGHRERAVGPGIRKIQKKQQACCSVC